VSDPLRRAPAGVQAPEKEKLRFVVNAPAPGVWEVDLQNGRAQREYDLQDIPAATAKYKLTISATR